MVIGASTWKAQPSVWSCTLVVNGSVYGSGRLIADSACNRPSPNASKAARKRVVFMEYGVLKVAGFQVGAPCRVGSSAGLVGGRRARVLPSRSGAKMIHSVDTPMAVFRKVAARCWQSCSYTCTTRAGCGRCDATTVTNPDGACHGLSFPDWFSLGSTVISTVTTLLKTRPSLDR